MKKFGSKDPELTSLTEKNSIKQTEPMKECVNWVLVSKVPCSGWSELEENMIKASPGVHCVCQSLRERERGLEVHNVKSEMGMEFRLQST